MFKDSNNLVLYISLLILLLLLILLFNAYNSRCRVIDLEMFGNQMENVPGSDMPKSVAEVYNQNSMMSGGGNAGNGGPAGYTDDDYWTKVEGGSSDPSVPSGPSGPSKQNSSPEDSSRTSCFPRDSLTSSDLLPKDATDSTWSQLNPSTGANIQDRYLLDAAHHIGINSQSGSLRNANLQLRSDPMIETKPVSPWLNSTIPPDINKRPLDIGSQPYWDV